MRLGGHNSPPAFLHISLRARPQTMMITHTHIFEQYFIFRVIIYCTGERSEGGGTHTHTHVIIYCEGEQEERKEAARTHTHT